jgi:serine/threonine protein kinase
MEPGQQVGSYRVESLIGAGGMAEVYKAFHTGLHRYEAIKALPPQMTFDSHVVERFLREARTAAGLDHPNIAAIHAVSDDLGPVYYFAMELVEGQDLGEVVRERGRLPLGETLHILGQIASALDYAHAHGVIHRDIKPGNILLSRDPAGRWIVKVVDFGIARAQEGSGNERLTRAGVIVGTPEYMSPEQGGSGDRIDHRTDQYSLGLMAYEMLCGQAPFPGEPDTSAITVILAHIRDAPPPPIEVNPDLPAAVNYALLRALARHPEERFQNCTEFVEALSGAHIPTSERVQGFSRSTPEPGVRPGGIAVRPSLRRAQMLASAVAVAGLILYYTGLKPTGPGSTTGNPVGISGGQLENPEAQTPDENGRKPRVNVEIPTGQGKVAATETAGGNNESLTGGLEGKRADSPTADGISHEPSTTGSGWHSSSTSGAIDSGHSNTGALAFDDGGPSTRLVSEADLVGKSAWALTLLRNDAYARHGYRFQRKDLAEYFENKPWYHPTTGSMDTVTREMSSRERTNAKTIEKYQESHHLKA